MLADGMQATVDGFVPKPGRSKTTTFIKAQKKNVMRGVNTVAKQDEAMWSALSGKPSNSFAKKCLLAITVFSNTFVEAVGQISAFADPGPQCDSCDAAYINSLNKTVDEHDPFLIYIQAPFVHDDESSKGFCNLKTFAEEQIKVGRTCVVADSRHTDRWSGLEPALCRGDLAFYCNDKGISDELVVRMT